MLRGAFRTLVAGQVLGQLGDGLTQIAFAQLVVFDIGRGATPDRIAGILLVTLLPFCIVGPLAGVFIDRWDRRRTLVIASQCRAALAAVAISASLWRSEQLAFVGVILLLSSSRFVLDAKGAVLPRTVAARDLVRANAISGLLGMTAAFVGAVGGAMFVSWSVLAGFVTGAAAYLGASACFTALPPAGGGARGDSVAAALTQLGRDLRAGLGEIAHNAELYRPLTAVWLHRLLLGGGFVLLVLVADRRYHFEASGYGLAIAVTGGAAALGTVAAPWLAGRWPAAGLLPLTFVPPAAVTAAVGYGPTLVGLVGGLAATAVSFQILKVLTDALVGNAAPDRLRGRVFAIYDVLYNMAFVLAGLLMIPLWRLNRERALLWWLAAAFAIGWLVTTRITPARWLRRRAAGRVLVAHKWSMRGLSILAGAAVVVVFPSLSIWWAAWFVLVPWLMLIRHAPSAREAALRAWWSAIGFVLAVHYWLIPSTSVFMLVIATAVGTLWTPWAALSWRLMSGELTPRRLLAALAVVPSGWVLIEAVRSWSALGGPWGLLGASQWRSPVFLAPASLGGVWLVSFLVVGANVVAVFLLDAPTWRLRIVAAAVATTLVGLGPFCYAVEPAPRGDTVMPIAVVQAGVVHDAAQRLADEIAATNRLQPGRYRLIVWGESSVGYDVLNRADLQSRLERLAAQQHSVLLVNVDAAGSGGAIRKLSVLLNADKILGTYQKMRLVPFGEYIPMRPLLGWLSTFTKAAAINRVRGTKMVVMPSGDITFTPLICFESAFPDMSRTAARRGADLLVFQSATTTFQGTWAPQQQASLAAVRAVETGRPALQASLAGTSAAFDAQGRRLLWHTAASGDATVTVPIADRNTPFDRYGDWLPALSVVSVALCIVVLSLRDLGESQVEASAG